MAMIFCSECGKQISDAAAVCPHCGAPVSRHPVQTSDKSGNGKATAALVLGVVSLIAWLLPLLGFPVSIIGLILGFAEIKKPGYSKASSAGTILSAIGLVLTIINSIAGAIAFS